MTEHDFEARGVEGWCAAATRPRQAARGRSRSVHQHQVHGRRRLCGTRNGSCVEGTRGELGVGLWKLLGQHDPSIFVSARVRFAKATCLLRILGAALRIRCALDLHRTEAGLHRWAPSSLWHFVKAERASATLRQPSATTQRPSTEIAEGELAIAFSPSVCSVSLRPSLRPLPARALIEARQSFVSGGADFLERRTPRTKSERGS